MAVSASLFCYQAHYEKFRRFVFPHVGFLDTFQPVHIQHGIHHCGRNAAAYRIGLYVCLSVVAAIPSFIIMSRLHLIDTYTAVILPAVGAPLGLFIMKQFMDQTVNLSVLESADIDGAGEGTKFFKLVMPMAKPAWITLMIFTVQSLWGLGSSSYIFSEQLKTLSYALSQVQAAGIARAGVGGAITVLMMLVPLTVFVVSQSNIIETMSTSGMKD